MPDTEPAGLNRFVHAVLTRFRESGVAMPQPKLPPKKDEGQTQPQPVRPKGLAKGIPAFVRRVMGEAPMSRPSVPSGSLQSLGYTLLPSEPQMSPAMPGVPGPEGVKQLTGGLLADVGVKMQPKFVAALQDVAVETKPKGEGGGYYDPTEGGRKIAVPGLIPSQQIGYPGPAYEEYPGNVGWVFLHETLHALDFKLDREGDLNEEVFQEMLDHFDKTDPKRSQWMRIARAGKNPLRGGPEPWVDGVLNYLFYHDAWKDTKMDDLLSDYFKWDKTRASSVSQGPTVDILEPGWLR